MYEDGQIWKPYKQFCQHFLAPLALMSKKDFYKIDQKVTSLKFHSNKNIDRNEIAGSILNSSINLVKNLHRIFLI